jgi:hypothetical protein
VVLAHLSEQCNAPALAGRADDRGARAHHVPGAGHGVEPARARGTVPARRAAPHRARDAALARALAARRPPGGRRDRGGGSGARAVTRRRRLVGARYSTATRTAGVRRRGDAVSGVGGCAPGLRHVLHDARRVPHDHRVRLGRRPRTRPRSPPPSSRRSWSRGGSRRRTRSRRCGRAPRA